MAEGQVYDLIIIGGGPGGLTAGIYAMRAALNTLLIEKGVPGGQVTMSAEVENYPGFVHVEGAELSMKFLEHAQASGLEILNEEVTELEPGLDVHRVRLGNGDELETHAVGKCRLAAP